MTVNLYVDWNEKCIATESEYLQMIQDEIEEEKENTDAFADFCEEQLDCWSNSNYHFSRYELLTLEECKKTEVLEELREEYNKTVEENVKDDLEWRWEKHHIEI